MICTIFFVTKYCTHEALTWGTVRTQVNNLLGKSPGVMNIQTAAYFKGRTQIL